MAPVVLARGALALLLLAGAAGCTGGPAPLTTEERGQRTRILTMRRAFHATKTASRIGAETAVARACAALRALTTEGEVRRAVTEIDQHPGFLAQIALEREGSVQDRADHRTIVARPQVYLVAVQHVLMWIEIDALYREVRTARREPMRLEDALRRLGDEDFRVAVTAPLHMPAHYRASPAMQAFVRDRMTEHVDDAGLDAAAAARIRAALPLVFPAPVTSDVGRYAGELLDEFLSGNTELRNTRVSWIIDALKNPELPQVERLALLRRMLRDSTAIDELLTVFDAKAQGAGFVMRRLGVSEDRDVQAAAAMALPPGSEVIPARALLGSEGVALAALRRQLSAPHVAVRAAAALAWEGVPGISLGDYDPRAPAAERAAALENLEERIADARAKAAAGTTPDGPAGAGSGTDPLNPFAKPKPNAGKAPTRAQRLLMKRALRAAGLLLDDFIRQLRREPASMVDVYDAYKNNHPWGGCHDAGDGRLIHEPSSYHFDVRRRPGGTALTVFADPPEGAGGRSYWWDNTTGAIKLAPEK